VTFQNFILLFYFDGDDELEEDFPFRRFKGDAECEPDLLRFLIGDFLSVGNFRSGDLDFRGGVPLRAGDLDDFDRDRERVRDLHVDLRRGIGDRPWSGDRRIGERRRGERRGECRYQGERRRRGERGRRQGGGRRMDPLPGGECLIFGRAGIVIWTVTSFPSICALSM